MEMALHLMVFQKMLLHGTFRQLIYREGRWFGVDNVGAIDYLLHYVKLGRQNPDGTFSIKQKKISSLDFILYGANKGHIKRLVVCFVKRDFKRYIGMLIVIQIFLRELLIDRMSEK
jgi:hypothetical protein